VITPLYYLADPVGTHIVLPIALFVVTRLLDQQL